MQYTIRNIPSEVDSALREKAERERKSLNEAAIDALSAGLALHAPVKYRDLSDLTGTLADEPQVTQALEEMRQIDPEDWE
jgi:hypothetical protein